MTGRYFQSLFVFTYKDKFFRVEMSESDRVYTIQDEEGRAAILRNPWDLQEIKNACVVLCSQKPVESWEVP